MALHGSAEPARIAHVEYRVLGPLSAYLDGVPQTLGGRRQRMVLAVLLAHANRVVAQDSLIEEVWGGSPPEAAKQTLHSYVSTLRKSLGGEIEREGDGYLLRTDPSGFDALRFEDCVERARLRLDQAPDEAMALLQEALGMWRGRAYGDLNGEPALSNEVIRLEEARLSALELRVEGDLLIGNHAAVVQELEALTREHPFRERLRGYLILALYRSGRQADALRSYQETRRFLGEELGIEPTQELQELEDRILTHDPGLDWQPVAGVPVRGERAARGYEMREELGRNAFGVVYRGFQSSVGREVTILAIYERISDAPDFIRRFESEMQAVSRLEHPHIAPLYDFWRDPDGAYVVTPHFAGGSLRTSLEGGPWNLSSTLRLVDQLSSGLTYAHRRGFTHGFLDLDHIVLDEESNVYLTELGLTHFGSGDGDKRDPAADVFDLAGLAFTVLAGDAPPGRTRIGALRPDLAELDHVFMRARHDDPGSRFQKSEEFRRALRQAAGVDVVPANTGAQTQVERRNPYKGLRAFHEADASDFHGRDALVEELVETVARNQLVTVVGPSGSGKSSLVRAGLVPALRSDAISGSRTWLITEMFPGTHPLEELEAALMRVATERPPDLFVELTSDSRGLTRVAKQVLIGENDELILIVDQFEELFSLVTSDESRSHFLLALLAAATDERSRVRIVLTLRADFFDQPLQYADFGEVMRGSLIAISPPTPDGLARAIAQPARDVGVDLEPGLVTRIVDDVKDEPGGLPLMQYALTELFTAREHNTLTMEGYQKTGGVLGALGRRAEEIYQHLSDEGKEAARQLFLRLVTVDELADDTRRRVRQTELRSLGINPAVLDDVLHQFAGFRLLSFDRDASSRTPTVEVAHEALIREWKRLRTWIDERREDLLIHRWVQVSARDWEDSGEDPSFLVRGSRLEQALIWQERTDIGISNEEMGFIEAGIEMEEQEEAERQALEEKAARRRKAAIGVLAGGLVIAGVLGALALDRAREARVSEAVARAQELSAAAIVAVEEDPELGVLLSLEAIDSTEEFGLDPVPEAISAIRYTQSQMRVDLQFDGGHQAIAFDPTGDRIATDRSIEERTSIAMWDAGNGELLDTLDAPHGSTGVISMITFSPDGDLIAGTWDYFDPEASFVEGSEVPGVDLFASGTAEHLRTLMGRPGFYHRPTFSSSGFVAASAETPGVDTWVNLWDPEDGALVHTYRSETASWWAEFIPGTDTLVIGHVSAVEPSGEVRRPGRIEAIDVTTDETMWSFESPGIDTEILIASPDGSMIALSEWSTRGIVQVRSIPDGEVLWTFDHPSPQFLTWSPDGSELAVSGNDADVTIFDSESGTVKLTLSGHQASVWALAYGPDGERLASVSLGEGARVWSLAPAGVGGDRAVELPGFPGDFTLSDDGDRLFGLMQNDSRVVDLASGSQVGVFPIPANQPLGGYIDADFTRLAGTSHDQTGHLFDVTTGEEILAFDPPCLAPRGLSPDGNLVLLDAGFLCEGDDAATSHVLNLATGEIVLDLGREVAWFGVFSGPTEFGEEYLVVNIAATRIEIYALDDGELIGTLESGDVGDLFFLLPSIDVTGRYLGLGTNGPRVVVVDMTAVIAGTPMKDAVILNIEGHKGNTPFVSVTSDGRAISSSFDGFYRMWDVESGRKLWEIRVDGLEDSGTAEITPDETELAYLDSGGVIRFTPLDNNVVIERARAALTRDLTDDECRQYLHTDGCELDS